MVIDHIGAYIINPNTSLYIITRCIGRISFPIFAFLLVEGIFHSRKPINYLIRLLSLGIIIDIFAYIFLHQYIGCVLITFFISGLTIYLFEQKGYLKLLGLITLSIGILSGFSFFSLNMQYSFYGIITVSIFYFSKKIAELLANFISTTFSINKEEYIKTQNFRLLYSLICSSLFISFNAICAIYANQLTSFFDDVNMIYSIQTYSVLSCIFIILYNGERGYNAKWFKYGCYLFFPLQFIFVYLLSLII